MEIGRDGENLGVHKKMLVAQANKNKAWSLDMPNNFQGITFQINQGHAANDFFTQIHPDANTAYNQFSESQTYLENFLRQQFQYGQQNNLRM